MNSTIKNQKHQPETAAEAESRFGDELNPGFSELVVGNKTEPKTQTKTVEKKIKRENKIITAGVSVKNPAWLLVAAVAALKLLNT